MKFTETELDDLRDLHQQIKFWSAEAKKANDLLISYMEQRDKIRHSAYKRMGFWGKFFYWMGVYETNYD